MSPEAGIGETMVNVAGVVALLHRHVTLSLCELVFRELRTKERARKWTLDVMWQFWVDVLLQAPKSLRHAVEELFGPGSASGLVASGPSAVCGRAQTLRWEFFRELFNRFVAAALPECAPRYESEMRAGLSHFADVWIVDGSGLDQIVRRLKVLRGVREVVIPGSIIACYDLFRGVIRQLHYYEKLLGGESSRLLAILDGVPDGTLLVADRGYCSIRLLAAIGRRKLHGLVRLRRDIVATAAEELGRFLDEGCEVVDRLVTLGTGQKGAKPIRVRLIEKHLANGEILRLATTVLDPQKLSALVALSLYRERWKVERMFFDLKCVLNLRRLYAANTNGVVMQVYVCAVLYNALRATQASIAQTHNLAPEKISPARLYPRAASAHMRLVLVTQAFDEIQALNPEVELRAPDWSSSNVVMTPLENLLVRERKGPRTKPGYSKARARTVALARHERPREPSP